MHLNLWRELHGPHTEDGSYILTGNTFAIDLPLPDDIAKLKRWAQEQLGARRKVMKVALHVEYKTIKSAGF